MEAAEATDSRRNGEAAHQQYASQSQQNLAATLSLLLEYLDSHPQPAFVSHLSEEAGLDEQLLVFDHVNPALREVQSLYGRLLHGIPEASPLSELLSRLVDSRKGKPPPFARMKMQFFGFSWTATIVRSRWAVVTAVEPVASHRAETIDAVPAQPSHAMLAKSPNPADDLNSTDPRLHRDSSGRLPLGTIYPQGVLGNPEHLQWVRQFDLASSPCGPIQSWSPQLRQVYEMALASPDPVCVLWGQDCTLLYNHPYKEVIGDKHPRAFGRPVAENWENVWPAYSKIFNDARETGQAVKHENIPRFIRRNGQLEETYFDLTFLPILAPDALVVGLYTFVHDKTGQVLSERRMRTLIDASDSMAPSTCLQDIWRSLESVLGDRSNDMHFAAIYSTSHERLDQPDAPPTFTLEASVGMRNTQTGPEKRSGHALPETNLDTAIRTALQLGTTNVISTADGTLTDSVVEHFHTCGVVVPCREAVIEPVRCDIEGRKAAAILIGINPLRKVDADYRLFTRLLARQVEGAITVLRNLERERVLSEAQIALQAESRFLNFAERAPVGIYMSDCEGNVTFCNETFEKMVGMSRADLARPMAWLHTLHPDCVQEIQAFWISLLNKGDPCTFDVQFKKPWAPRGENSAEFLDRTWGLASSYPELSENGEVKGILGCVTDISSVRWAEKIQSEKLSEALELKRQQENFLDITSHEMRNPLTAIFHCAAELVEQLGNHVNDPASVATNTDVLADCITMAETIIYCANHQKRIVDDVLTLSKLDSRLLQIFPIGTRPLELVESVLAIFASELRASDIESSIEVGEGYKRLGIGLVLLDPHRITQIVINLLSNAIKFMKTGLQRRLRLLIDASLTEPEESHEDLRYVPTGIYRQDPTNQVEWGLGESIFLIFSIQDTGLGMTQEETSQLFNRFRQASPRTHTRYGGSGLGLFISRELVEMHGGRIGVSSQPGLGSSFSFFVKARRDAESRPLSSEATSTSFVETQRLRLSTPPLQGVAHARPANGVSRDQSKGAQMPSADATSVLIVEDNIVNQRLLEKLIAKNGCEARIANHGEEALAIIAGSTWNASFVGSTHGAFRLDVVLCDIEMPVMDGKTLVRQIRQLQDDGVFRRGIPVIAVTGNARAEQVKQALDCGFDALVTKPYKIGELLDAMEGCLKKARDLGPKPP